MKVSRRRKNKVRETRDYCRVPEAHGPKPIPERYRENELEEYAESL
jgi:hypothetical protein